MTEMTKVRCAGRSPAGDAKIRMSRSTVPGVVVAVAAMLAGGAGLIVPSVAQAQAKLHEITWAHTTPGEIARFVVFVADTEGNQAAARQINVGKPANPTFQNGRFTYSAVISVDLDEYVAVAAVSLNGSISSLSNWQGVPPSVPGQPYYIP